MSVATTTLGPMEFGRPATPAEAGTTQPGHPCRLCGRPLPADEPVAIYRALGLEWVVCLACVGVCATCGAAKVPGTECPGCDECNHGPNGGPAQACEGWGSYCCLCGGVFARGQL